MRGPTDRKWSVGGASHRVEVGERPEAGGAVLPSYVVRRLSPGGGGRGDPDRPEVVSGRRQSPCRSRREIGSWLSGASLVCSTSAFARWWWPWRSRPTGSGQWAAPATVSRSAIFRRWVSRYRPSRRGAGWTNGEPEATDNTPGLHAHKPKTSTLLYEYVRGGV